MQPVFGRFLGILLALSFIRFGAPNQTSNHNLATTAIALASESQSDELGPQKGIDGNLDSRWSGIPGHNSGVWYELDWKEPVKVAQIVVHQYDRFTFEWDIQTWDDTKGIWVSAGHYGKPGMKLPLVVVCPVKPTLTSKVRIANITNGPSFTEVEVFGPDHLRAGTIELASDLNGNFVGMLCDAYGGSPIAGQEVVLNTHSPTGHYSAKTKSDDHGMFWAPMPLEMSDAVIISSPGCETRHFAAAGFQRAITPISDEVHPLQLSTGWKFLPNPADGFEAPGFDDSHWPEIKVPAHWTMEGFKGNTGGYRRRFNVPAGGGRLMLRFDGVYSGAEVWVNGKQLGYHEGGFTPFEMDVSDAVHAGSNVIAVRVVEHTTVSDDLDKMSQYADFPLAGIMRKVTLFRVPDIHVEGYDEATQFSPDLKTAGLAGSIRVVAHGQAVPKKVMAKVTITIPGGNSFETGPIPVVNLLSAGVLSAPFSLNIPNPRPWSAEHPNLYGLTIKLSSDGKLLQTLNQTIGLRQTDIRGTEILINKSPVKFRGTCHHDQYPTLGRAVTPALEKQDIRMIKEANLNSLRTSHYPPMPELIADADRMGLYVEDEADFCWVGASDDLRNTPRIIQLEGELLARDRNHPSVFIWSLCNESSFGYGFERAHEFVRAADPSRPNSAATSAWLEVATEHNPISTARMQQDAGVDKPILWDEAWCIFQGIWGDVDEMWADPGIRDYYAEPLKKVYADYMASKNVSGSMIWAWSDDLFCVPGTNSEYGRSHTRSHFIDDQYSIAGRGIVGDAPWGVVDGWRRRKPEFWITKKLQSPIKMDEKPYQAVRGPEFSNVELSVENQLDFTNLNEMRITWSSGEESGAASADVGPRSKGQLKIHGKVLGPNPLIVAFRDSHGQLVDKFQFPPSAMVGDPVFAVLTPIIIRNESSLAGETTYVDGQEFELGFERGSGWLRRCVAGDMSLLLDSPSIHVLPIGKPFNAMPVPSDWHIDDFSVRKDGRDGRIVQTGHYDDFNGTYVWRITPEGEVTIHAKFTYSGKDLMVREVGMTMSVPRNCDELTWDRNAEWGVYPDDHIGRPRGTTTAFYNHGTMVPPTWPWSQDDSPMGSNDFRSTKRNINKGSIGYPYGSNLQIESDGRHALRAAVASDRINVSVLDWYGGSGVGIGEFDGNYGRGKLLRTGEVIESTLRFWLHPRPRPVAAKRSAKLLNLTGSGATRR